MRINEPQFTSRMTERCGRPSDSARTAPTAVPSTATGTVTRALCEKLLSYASPLLLYAEEIDPHTGRQLGNFAQAFSHLALINALVHLIREDERLGAATAIRSDLDPEPLARTPD
jgi:hypothetical protein